jgi:hypothetical protein
VTQASKGSQEVRRKAFTEKNELSINGFLKVKSELLLLLIIIHFTYGKKMMMK